MVQKTLLALGGSRLLMPLIEAVHTLGHRIVTCDYLPDNFAHAYADDYRNVSIVDQSAVLGVARDVDADGIVSFAADPGVIAAAYTAEKLGLPKQVSASAAVTLQTKHLFREFLARNGFPSPAAWRIDNVEQAAALTDKLQLPVIVKPADAAGSKGVTRVDELDSLVKAVEHALSYSMSSQCVIETYINTVEPQRSAEGFAVDGEFIAFHFMDQLFDSTGLNPYAPVGNVLPSTMNRATEEQLVQDLQRIARLLDFGSGIFNIEVRVDTDGTPYIIELSPRGGGNRLAEFIRAATGQDLIRAAAQVALGETPEKVNSLKPDGAWLQEIIYSDRNGIFEQLTINAEHRRKHIKDLCLWVRPGDRVSAFTHASFALGSIFSHFNTHTAVDDYHTARSTTLAQVTPEYD